MQIEKQQPSRRFKTAAKHANDVLTIHIAEGPSVGDTTVVVPKIVISVACTSRTTQASLHTTYANEEDRTKVLALQGRIRRQVFWTKRLMIGELALAAVALVAACYASTRWPFLAWAGLEFGLLLHGLARCRDARRSLCLLQMDLASGVVRESVGRVQSFRLFWRVVCDSATGAEYFIVAPLLRPSAILPGTEVIYRAAIQSRVVISLRERTL